MGERLRLFISQFTWLDWYSDAGGDAHLGCCDWSVRKDPVALAWTFCLSSVSIAPLPHPDHLVLYAHPSEWPGFLTR